MWHFFDISKVSIGKLRPYTVVPYVAMPVSHLLPLQVLSLFLCWYLLTLQRFTAQLVSSVPARVLSRPCEVPNQKAPLRLLCKTQVMSNLRGATNPKHIRFIHWMPLLIIWSHLGKSLDDYLQLRPSMNPCHAYSNSTLGGWIFHPSSRQDVKQDTEAMAVLLWLRFLAQKAISAGGEELPR